MDEFPLENLENKKNPDQGERLFTGVIVERIFSIDVVRVKRQT